MIVMMTLLMKKNSLAKLKIKKYEVPRESNTPFGRKFLVFECSIMELFKICYGGHHGSYSA
jgi:hypothetical protein